MPTVPGVRPRQPQQLRIIGRRGKRGRRSASGSKNTGKIAVSFNAPRISADDSQHLIEGPKAGAGLSAGWDGTGQR
jgi:hypothetical protein